MKSSSIANLEQSQPSSLQIRLKRPQSKWSPFDLSGWSLLPPWVRPVPSNDKKLRRPRMLLSRQIVGFILDLLRESGQPNTVTGIGFDIVITGDTCWDIIARHGNTFTMSQLLCWNAEINHSCSNLIPGRRVCVKVEHPDLAQCE